MLLILKSSSFKTFSRRVFFKLSPSCPLLLSVKLYELQESMTLEGHSVGELSLELLQCASESLQLTCVMNT